MAALSNLGEPGDVDNSFNLQLKAFEAAACQVEKVFQSEKHSLGISLKENQRSSSRWKRIQPGNFLKAVTKVKEVLDHVIQEQATLEHGLSSACGELANQSARRMAKRVMPIDRRIAVTEEEPADLTSVQSDAKNFIVKERPLLPSFLSCPPNQVFLTFIVQVRSCFDPLLLHLQGLIHLDFFFQKDQPHNWIHIFHGILAWKGLNEVHHMLSTEVLRKGLHHPREGRH